MFSFKQPTREDLDHDFMWRYVKCLPERGRIGIFNRSYYEEVLVVRVHPEVLRGQRLPAPDVGKKIWDQRLTDIAHFEDNLTRQGTIFLKLFLYVSRARSRKSVSWIIMGALAPPHFRAVRGAAGLVLRDCQFGKSGASYPRSASSMDPDLRRDKSAAASLLSCASPVVSASRTGKPLLSTTACILLVKPPRDRPMDCLLLRAMQAAC